MTTLRVPLICCVLLAMNACSSLIVAPSRSPAELESAQLTKSCALGVPSTRVRIADDETTSGVDVVFSTTMSGVGVLRDRVRDQAKATGPNRHAGRGHGGHHGGYHDHGLQLWSMGAVATKVEDTPSGARLSITAVDPSRSAYVRKLVIERVAQLEAQGCHD